ncbi:MAG: DUF5671 domain-containing protein [Thermoflexales bacterium]|nr:DUF5671 domain-containing protein [Thermoflexales bacterium]MDW8352359.1 DUF5671 domain-containing protein [Anaerolineae bacterium]
MWAHYVITVSFLALAIAYGATLFAGWSIARAVPGVAEADQMSVLARSLAIAIIAWPIWAIHWRWAKRDWNWNGTVSQLYLAFFTITGLIAGAWIGMQFISRLLEVLLGSKAADGDSVSYLIGALWSTLVSLLIWVYHGSIWIRHRRRTTP